MEPDNLAHGNRVRVTGGPYSDWIGTAVYESDERDWIGVDFQGNVIEVPVEYLEHAPDAR